MLAHFPCPQGHYDSQESAVRSLSFAQKQMLSFARAKSVQLTQSLAAMRGQRNTKVCSPENKHFADNHGEDCAGILENP